MSFRQLPKERQPGAQGFHSSASFTAPSKEAHRPEGAAAVASQDGSIGHAASGPAPAVPVPAAWGGAPPMDQPRLGEFEAGSRAHHFERSLDRISSAAEKKEMNAYGANKDKVLAQIDSIRMQQIDLFRRQMKLEVNLSVDEGDEENDDDMFSAAGFSEKFQKRFKRKERTLDAIRNQLESLSVQIKEVNNLSTSSKMPSNPGLEEEEEEAEDGEATSSRTPPRQAQGAPQRADKTPAPAPM